MSDSFIKSIFNFRKVNYIKVAGFENDSAKDMIIVLEPNSEEITVSSGQSFDLLVPEDAEALPLDIVYHDENSVQVLPTAEAVAWKIMFEGRIVDVDYIVRLKDHEEA